MKIKRVFIRVDGDHGAKIGLGHVTRMMKVYFFFKKKYNQKLIFFFITKKYRVGIDFIKRKIKKRDKIINLSQLKNIQVNKRDLFILDTLGIEKEISFFLKKKGIKNIISFDETNLTRFNSGIIINGIFFTKKKLKKKKKLKIYQGTKYLILDQNFIKKKNHKQKIFNNIAITSGGADFKNMMFKTLKILLEFSEIKKISVVIGFGVKKKNKVFELKDKRIHFIKNLKNLNKLFLKSSITICTGGTVMFESIASGQKPIIIQSYDNQKYAINFFKKKKVIFYIGLINDKNLGTKLLNFFFKNQKKKYNSRFIKKNSSVIDGKGFFRVCKIIDKIIN